MHLYPQPRSGVAARTKQSPYFTNGGGNGKSSAARGHQRVSRSAVEWLRQRRVGYGDVPRRALRVRAGGHSTSRRRPSNDASHQRATWLVVGECFGRRSSVLSL